MTCSTTYLLVSTTRWACFFSTFISRSHNLFSKIRRCFIFLGQLSKLFFVMTADPIVCLPYWFGCFVTWSLWQAADLVLFDFIGNCIKCYLKIEAFSCFLRGNCPSEYFSEWVLADSVARCLKLANIFFDHFVFNVFWEISWSVFESLWMFLIALRVETVFLLHWSDWVTPPLIQVLDAKSF